MLNRKPEQILKDLYNEIIRLIDEKKVEKEKVSKNTQLNEKLKYILKETEITKQKFHGQLMILKNENAKQFLKIEEQEENISPLLQKLVAAQVKINTLTDKNVELKEEVEQLQLQLQKLKNCIYVSKAFAVEAVSGVEKTKSEAITLLSEETAVVRSLIEFWKGIRQSNYEKHIKKYVEASKIFEQELLEIKESNKVLKENNKQLENKLELFAKLTDKNTEVEFTLVKRSLSL